MGEDLVSTTVDLVACEMPGGCANVLEYAGVGRRPKYCQQSVGGIVHNRLNAHKVNAGLLALPARGASGGVMTAPATGAARPVSSARASLEVLRTDIATAFSANQEFVTAALGRLEELLATTNDPDAAAVEVSAAHREARAVVDAADATTEAATRRAHLAQTAAAEATAARQLAEQTARDALVERDTARDIAAQHAAELDIARTQAADLAADLAALRAQYDADLTAAREALTEERHRAETAERDLARADDAAIAARTQLADTRTQLDTAQRRSTDLAEDLASTRASAAQQQLRADSVEHELQSVTTALDAAHTRRDQLLAELAATREHLAETRGQLDGARTAIAQEKMHSTQRLADQRDAYEAQLHATRAARATVERDGSTAGVTDEPDSTP